MKNDRRYTYLNGTEYKTFTSFRKMLEWAKDEAHDGKYYISTPAMTFTHTRTQILDYAR